MLRSGTTLINQIVENSHNIKSLYQPITSLFLEAKKQFYKTIKYEENYFYLSHRFIYYDYDLDYFTDFLLNNRIIYDNKQKYFIEHYQYLLFQQTKGDYLNFGCKEVMCEEFVPYFLENDINVIIIIRDPRDVITSMNYGNSLKYTGAIRPTLFNLRNWLKSAYIIDNFKYNKKLFWFKYESLIFDTQQITNKLSDFLKIKMINLEKVQQNSSFNNKQGISMKSVGRWKKILPINIIRFIEAVLFDDIKKYNYSLNQRLSFIDKINIINSFNDPYKIRRNEFNQFYLASEKNIREEIYRISKVHHKLTLTSRK